MVLAPTTVAPHPIGAAAGETPDLIPPAGEANEHPVPVPDSVT